MNVENFLPSDSWMADARQLIKNPLILPGLRAVGLIGLPALAVLGPFAGPLIWASLIKHFFEQQKKKKVKAIMEGFPGQHTEEELEKMSGENRQEFNRLFRLVSDEFFRKYAQEQADHVKAKELIVEMQKRIDEMQERFEFMRKKNNERDAAIAFLKEEIEVYKSILSQWKRKAA